MEDSQVGKLRYEVFGPFAFRAGWDTSHRDALKEFWSILGKEDSTKGLDTAVGVYVWTFKEGTRRIPWNVGLTDRQGFKARFLQKETSFLRLLNQQPKAQIEVYLLALRSKTGRFRKPTDSLGIKANHWLETMLIGSALIVNPDLRNKSKAGYLKKAVVDGYLNDTEEKRNEAAKSFSAMINAQPRKRN